MNFLNTSNINHLWSSLIVEELVRAGVTYFCIAPGSRSSPLTAQVALNKKARSFIHFDERGLAFHALGYASASGKPAAVITTSGTAVANLFPAVIEASKKKLPLIVLTADRPPELRQTGAHQTIDQVKIYGDYVRWQVDMPTPTRDIAPEFVLTTIDQALMRAQGELKGPVHINCMYREPLAPSKTKEAWGEYTKAIKPWLASTKMYTQYRRSNQQLSNDQLKEIKQTLNKIKNGVVAVGKLSNEKQRRAVLSLAQKLNWPIFPDITSGLRIGPKEKNVIHHFDQILLSDKLLSKIKPDGILHLGGRMTSKRYYELIECLRPKSYIMVLNHPLRNDPVHNVTLRIQSSIENFCQAVAPTITKRASSKLLTDLIKVNRAAERVLQSFLKKKAPINEFATAQSVSELIPSDQALFLASSLPVREMDMFAACGFQNVEIGSNRGASGIDGTIATACGYSIGLKRGVTLLIGDLAFLYDLNSLAMLKTLKKKMTIVVLNNDGGGIFSFLPIATSSGLQASEASSPAKRSFAGSPSIFEKYFGTPHGFTFKQAANLFNLDYHQPKTNTEFAHVYQQSLSAKSSSIIEVNTKREGNTLIQKRIAKEIDSLAKPRGEYYGNNNKVKKQNKQSQVDLLRRLRRRQIPQMRRHR